jgi:lysozyme
MMADALGSAITNTDPNSCVNLKSGRLSKPWNVSPQGVQFTQDWEAFRGEMYDHDGAGGKGNTTIGYGHLVHTGPISGAASEKQFLKGITETQATQLMQQDLAAPERIVNENINVPLYQYEYDALVDFVYNHRGHNQGMFDAVNSGHYDRVPEKFMEYTAARGAHPKGLVKRRQAQANVFKSGAYDATH